MHRIVDEEPASRAYLTVLVFDEANERSADAFFRSSKEVAYLASFSLPTNEPLDFN